MYCSKCGAPNQEGMRFCERCGAPLTVDAPQSAPQPAQQPAQQSAPRSAPQPVSQAASVNWGQGESAVMRTIRQLALSPVCLTAVIAYTASIFLNIIANVFQNNQMAMMANLIASMDELMALAGESAGLSDMFFPMMSTSVNPVAAVGALIGSIPSILVVVGMWMTLASAADKSGAPMRTGGLTIIRVINIIGLVGVCLMAFGCELLLILLTVGLAQLSSDIIGIFVAIILLVTVIFALCILYSVKVVGTIGSMINTIRTQTVKGKISTFVAVLSIISGAVSVFSLVSFFNMLQLLICICKITMSIGFGIFLFQYRDRMNAVAQDGGYMSGPADDRGAYIPTPPPAAEHPSVYEPASAVYAAEPDPVPVYATPGETAMLNQQTVPETTVLNQTPVALPTLYLRRVRDNSMILIDRPQFRIGRDPGVADFIVTDNTAVGRQHADIIQRGESFFVVDLNSTNHTYLNGTQIQPLQEYPLQNQDQLVLGDECFQVEISN